MSMKRRPTVSERLRQRIETCQWSRYELAKQTGVTQSSLSRFIHGQGNLSLDAVDALAVFLELELVESPTTAKGAAAAVRARKAGER